MKFYYLFFVKTFHINLLFSLIPALGWIISAFGVMQVPFWAIYTITKQDGTTWSEKMALTFKMKSNYGPLNPDINEKYQKYMGNLERQDAKLPAGNWILRFKRHLFG